MINKVSFCKYKLELTLGLISTMLIPVSKRLVIIPFLLWFVTTLINSTIDIFKKKKSVIDFKNLFPILILPVFFILHLIGMIYTNNIEYGMFDLEIKISLLLIPLAVFFRSFIYQFKQKTFLLAFILGCTISFFINISKAYISYLSDGEIDNFFYSNITPEIHPSYMALYVSICLFALLHYGQKLFSTLKKPAFFVYILFIILLIYLLLLSSRAGIISMTLVFSCYAAFKLSSKYSKKIAVIIGMLIFTLPFFTISLIPALNMRFQAMKEAILHSDNANIDAYDGTYARISIIKSTYIIAWNNLPFGVGTGDIKDEITKYYESKGSKSIKTRYLNAHNQYIQSAIALGIPGFVMMLILIITGFYTAYRKRNILFFLFIALLFIHLLFESMLEVQAGVLFITLFYALFCIWSNENQKI